MKWAVPLFIALFLLGCQTDGDQETEEPTEESSDETASEEDSTEESGETESSENGDPNGKNVEELTFLEEPETVVDDLNSPWNIVKNDDEFYMTERSGSIVYYDGENMERQTIELEQEVASGQGEGGLLGMVLDPEDDQTAYIYHTYQTGEGMFNRIVAIELSDQTWQETEILVDEIPAGRIHDGGRLAIGPDDYLYATTGDAGDENLSQETDNLAGKILRMDFDGSIPDDQPFEDSLIYSYGHRNPQGLDWNENDELYSSEHGSTAYDEINHIEPGNNYGWPVVRGDDTADGMEPPTIHSGEETWAPSGAAFDDEGNLLVTGLAGQSLYRFDIESGNQEIILDDEGRLRDILVADGEAYVLTNNTDGRGNPEEGDDRLLKIAD
ncbi:PQQ-dependent sugar dehydrogenase [Alkalibacillus almallahensis]|uniref:PQQ-dependent sugar dehydrogenase n=1 Tax=Alkalibacillus almallahensis TaxID=1379154 RepID=UPI00141F30A9|nr:PQQ-dependent sugar dehydrogenase [Alkalibacillus almallahensis]NIK13070.1 glucose/arabinose dehydrogenase [Alkalibacillus almallahensis]